jgi:hypothetical protein
VIYGSRAVFATDKSASTPSGKSTVQQSNRI